MNLQFLKIFSYTTCLTKLSFFRKLVPYLQLTTLSHSCHFQFTLSSAHPTAGQRLLRLSMYLLKPNKSCQTIIWWFRHLRFYLLYYIKGQNQTPFYQIKIRNNRNIFIRIWNKHHVNSYLNGTTKQTYNFNKATKPKSFDHKINFFNQNNLQIISLLDNNPNNTVFILKIMCSFSLR